MRQNHGLVLGGSVYPLFSAGRRIERMKGGVPPTKRTISALVGATRPKPAFTIRTVAGRLVYPLPKPPNCRGRHVENSTIWIRETIIAILHPNLHSGDDPGGDSPARVFFVPQF